MNPATQVRLALVRQGIPAIGVSIGDVADQTTWRIDYPKTVTQDQREAATAFLQTYDLEAEARIWADAEAFTTFNEQKLIKAVAMWAAGRFAVPLMTARNEILAIYIKL